MSPDHNPAAVLSDHRLAIQAQSLLSDPMERSSAAQALREQRRKIVSEQANQLLARWLAATASAQQEALVWFWFNHFNVFWNKGLVGAALPSYLDDAIRPHVNSRFADLLLAVVTHPAMLVYLDNTGNTADKLNENLARELLELHTLGVAGGYNQADIRETARLLTGFGLRPLTPVRWPAHLAPLVRAHGEFLFDPQRHDFGAKMVMGRRYAADGYDELRSLCNQLAIHPATARRIVNRLAVYLTGDTPQPDVETQARAIYLDTGGNLGATTEFLQRALRPSAGSFKPPMDWVLDAMRLLADGRPVVDASPIQRWLAQLGQPVFGRTTPDGYPLRGADWLSAGQFAQRFEIAPQMVSRQEQVFGSASAPAALMESEAVTALRARAGEATSAALARARRPADQLSLLLSSPEFMHR